MTATLVPEPRWTDTAVIDAADLFAKLLDAWTSCRRCMREGSARSPRSSGRSLPSGSARRFGKISCGIWKPGSATTSSRPSRAPPAEGVTPAAAAAAAARASSGRVKPSTVVRTRALRAPAAREASSASGAGSLMVAAAAERCAGVAGGAEVWAALSRASWRARSPARVAACCLSLFARPRIVLALGWACASGLSAPMMVSPSRNARWWSWPLSRRSAPTAAWTCRPA